MDTRVRMLLCEGGGVRVAAHITHSDAAAGWRSGRSLLSHNGTMPFCSDSRAGLDGSSTPLLLLSFFLSLSDQIR